MSRDFIAEASAELAAAQCADGTISAYYLANSRLALEAAKEACRQLELIVGAREREAARVVYQGPQAEASS